jgi:hypothetical protein
MRDAAKPTSSTAAERYGHKTCEGVNSKIFRCEQTCQNDLANESTG